MVALLKVFSSKAVKWNSSHVLVADASPTQKEVQSQTSTRHWSRCGLLCV